MQQKNRSVRPLPPDSYLVNESFRESGGNSDRKLHPRRGGQGNSIEAGDLHPVRSGQFKMRPPI
ncbi:hypothetical protein [Paenibacillus ihbetae]|nr:hypothetical protein [Paenibacillus ihbetae]